MDELTAVLRARQFVRKVGINFRPVEMLPYLNEAKALYKVRHDFPDDVSGNTARISGRHHIFVNGNHTGERQRFTILHEIAHIVLGLRSIHDSLIKSAVLMGYTRRPIEEVCCDAFAAECLLPFDLFKQEANQQAIGFDAVKQLATDYQASLTCTGSRFAVVHEVPCAFILSEGGIIRYIASSQSMRERRGWIKKIGMPLPNGSVAQKIRSGDTIDGTLEVDAELWIDDPRRGEVSLLEESRSLPEWDQTLSLLWFDDDGDSSGSVFDDDDDSGLLEELDGILPWPSKKRRR